MAATSSGHRAAILREVEAELNRTDENATEPPTFGDYAADVERRMATLQEECHGECVTRPHKWSDSGARCTRTGCNVAGTGDRCNDGNCEGED